VLETGTSGDAETSDCSTVLPARSQKLETAHVTLRVVAAESENNVDRHTFSIALLVRSPLNPFFPFLSLRIDAFFGYTVFDTSETRSGIVALLARFLTVGARILDLSALRTEWWWRD